MLLTAFTTILLLTDTLDVSVISASLKENLTEVRTINMSTLERSHINSVKDASFVLPNFYQPDYGSRTTSSIYIRGIGSRMDQSAMGLYIDEIPVMNKSNYDFEFLDIRNMKLLKGPQGTLYGRNSNSGAMIINTLSPKEKQGLYFSAEYSPSSAWKASSYYGGQRHDGRGFSISAWASHYDGDFINEYNGSFCDPSDSYGMRSRTVLAERDHFRMENIANVSYVNEGGYAYMLMDGDGVHPVNYNDDCSYRRFSITDGLIAKGDKNGFDWSAVASWQFLDDNMALDNDFTALSLFDMVQAQHENSFTFEAMVRPSDRQKTWQPLTGIFAFGRFLDLSAPVTFQRDGIDMLILDNANKNIQTIFPGFKLEIEDQSFIINSDFRLPSYGLAVFHSSDWKKGRWTFTAGLRTSVEYTLMKYDSNGGMNFRFNMTMPDFKEVRSVFKGEEHHFYLNASPSFGAGYSFDKALIKASVKHGFKAGGYNTQIFSDILQNIMMNDMMGSLGMHFIDNDAAKASSTVYKPESVWNFEINGHWQPSVHFDFDATVFYMDCENQQVTVMPKGSGTGRMMSNAASSWSSGTELSISFSKGGLSVNGDYGLTISKYSDYQFDDQTNYAGKYIPYAPLNTMSLSMGYGRSTERGFITGYDVSLNLRGAGKIFWDNENTITQPFYTILGATASVKCGRVSYTLFGNNLLDTAYNTFCFTSVSRSFVAAGRPMRVGLKCSIDF